MALSQGVAEGYELLSRLRREDIEAVYEAVADRGLGDERCPRSFEEGVRLPNLLDEFEARFKELVSTRAPHTRIAAFCLHFFIFRQPLKNCNHRTGLGIAEWVLRCFNRRLTPEYDGQILEFMTEFEKRGMSIEEVEDWMAQNLSAI